MAYVVARDIAVGTRGRDTREVDAQLAGERTHGWLRQRLTRRDTLGYAALLLGCFRTDLLGCFRTDLLGCFRTAQPSPVPRRVVDAVADEHGLTLADLDREDRGADRHDGTGLHEQCGDTPREGARQFDDGLGSLDVDDRLVDIHGVTDSNAPADDLGLGQSLAHIRQQKLADGHRAVTRSIASSTRSTSGR